MVYHRLSQTRSSIVENPRTIFQVMRVYWGGGGVPPEMPERCLFAPNQGQHSLGSEAVTPPWPEPLKTAFCSWELEQQHWVFLDRLRLYYKPLSPPV